MVRHTPTEKGTHVLRVRTPMAPTARSRTTLRRITLSRTAHRIDRRSSSTAPALPARRTVRSRRAGRPRPWPRPGAPRSRRTGPRPLPAVGALSATSVEAHQVWPETRPSRATPLSALQSRSFTFEGVASGALAMPGAGAASTSRPPHRQRSATV